MKFLASDKWVRFVALLIIGMAPSDFKSFSATFKIWSDSFYESAIPMHSPPSGPRSLSFMDNDSRILFLIRRAEIQTAPYIPREFFRIDPSITPISKWVSILFSIKSSKNNSSPSPEIIFEAKFKLLS